MKFIHAADIHFDAPFTTITNRLNLGQERRLDQRRAFREMINFAKERKVDFIFLTGDIYENEYVRKSTIDYINNLFKEIPDIKIIIVPGNHDPKIKNSFYDNYNWAENVLIMSEKIRKIEYENIDIYGYGFENFNLYSDEIKAIEVDQKRFNILVSHGDIYNKSEYNYIDKEEIKKFDITLLGHIHKRDEIYCGSLISLGFDELGEHGFRYGKIVGGKYLSEFIKVDNKEFKKENLDVSDIESEEELIEKINSYFDENVFFEICLVGVKKINFNIDYKLINKNIIKIKDLSKNIINTSNKLQNKLVEKLENKLKNSEITEEEFEKAVSISNSIFNK